MKARTLALSGIAVGSLGIFLGFFYYFQPNPQLAVKVVTLLSVGVLGVLAFVRHVLFQKEDAERMGWVTDHPDWQYEVGFANLAFGVMGFLTSLGNWGSAAQGVMLGGFGFYLLQAGLLNAYRSLYGKQKSFARFFRSGLVTLVFSLAMLFFAWVALSSK